MADDGLIDDYLARVGAGLIGRRSTSSLAEIEDHLREHASDSMSKGCTREEAERRAVAAFGTPDLIAGQLNDVGGVRPSKVSSWSGLFGMIGPVLLVATLLLTPFDGDTLPPTTWWIAMVCILLGVLGLVVRTRGAFGRWRGAVIVVLVVAGLLLVPVGYGLVGVVAAVCLLGSLAILCDVIVREAVLPRPATMLLLVSIVLMSLLAPTSLEKESAPYYAGLAALVVGWIWLQYTLWSERPDRAAARAKG